MKQSLIRNMDFSLSRYKNLIKTLIRRGYYYHPLIDFQHQFENSFVGFRQDVDDLPGNSLQFAKLQSELGISSTFYFRIVPASFDKYAIQEISKMGHEVGYHYEDLSFANAKLKAQGSRLRAHGEKLEKEIVKIGIESFKSNLDRLRKLVPVKTICMHGSPMSRWDSRLLWKYYDYRDFGIEIEPYFDLNMEEMLYLTDTGRRWNGNNISVRDKGFFFANASEYMLGQRVQNERDLNLNPGTLNFEPFSDWVRKPIPGSLMNMTEKAWEFQTGYNFKSSNDIILTAERGELPDKIMMTFHPQRWTDKPLPWVKELFWQNVKNVGKYFMIKIRS